jgi:hypothetical protein
MTIVKCCKLISNLNLNFCEIKNISNLSCATHVVWSYNSAESLRPPPFSRFGPTVYSRLATEKLSHFAYKSIAQLLARAWYVVKYKWAMLVKIMVVWIIFKHFAAGRRGGIQ